MTSSPECFCVTTSVLSRCAVWKDCCCPIKSLKCAYGSVAVTAVQVPKESDLVIQRSEDRIVKLRPTWSPFYFCCCGSHFYLLVCFFFLCVKVYFDCWSAFPLWLSYRQGKLIFKINLNFEKFVSEKTLSSLTTLNANLCVL